MSTDSPTTELPKQYDHQAAQERWYKFWEEKGYFQYGGSTIVLAFGPGAARLDEDIARASDGGIESSVRALSAIGKKGDSHS